MHINEPSWISLEPLNHTVFDTLTSFIDNAITDPTNVQQLADSTTTTLTTTGTQNPSLVQYIFESRVLYGILLTIVKQIDAAAAEQDHLITLLLTLRHVPLPETAAQEVDPDYWDADMNHELHKLVNIIGEIEWDAPLHPRLEDRLGSYLYPKERGPWRQDQWRYLTAAEWTSVSAFVARLHGAAPDVPRFDVRGLFAMIEALEQPLSPSQLEDVVPAAACWVIYAGKELRSNDIPYAYYDDDGGSKRTPWSKGQLWNGQHAFNSARWEFWMQRFKAIAERRDANDTVRQAALRAFEAGS